MRLACIVFLAGVFSVHWYDTLPSWWILGLVIGSCLLAIVKRWWRVAFALAGFFWAGVDANMARTLLLPLELTQQTVVATGVVTALPVVLEQGTRFGFRIERIDPYVDLTRAAATPVISLPTFSGLVRLSWYGPQVPLLNAGDRWRLVVRMRRPVGFSNPGGFDYERWSFQQHMVASGYVRKSLEQLPTITLQYPLGLVDQLRQRLADTIRRLLPHRPQTAALILALTVGVRSDLSADQWRTLQDTGTSHLMAISGLHVGFLAMLALVSVQSLWRRWYWGCARWPAQKVGTVAALLAAASYALLAGFSVPTQRALIMIAALLFGLLRGRTMLPGTSLTAAACAIVILDPRTPLEIGFWLSFAAVTAIQFLLLAPLTGNSITGKSTAWCLIRTQLAISLGLFPLLLFFFGSQPMLAPLVNLVAIPLTSWGIVPLALAGTAISTFSEPVATIILTLASWLIEWLMGVLHSIAVLDLKLHVSGEISLVALASAIVGVIWLGAPHPWSARWIGLLMFFPLLTTSPTRPLPGQAWITLLDVGQGLAVVVETATHVLLYDTGPRFGSTSDAGERVVVPYFRHRGIRHIDRIIVSHDDKDHAGGLDSIVRFLDVGDVLSSRPERLSVAADTKPCRSGQSWVYDGVAFSIVYPHRISDTDNDNNVSCVLQISVGNTAALLPGDLQHKAEKKLIATHPQSLASALLIVPHHGSASSSSVRFLDAVQPQLGLISAGWYNYFKHPRKTVVDRYRERGIDLLSTSENGAVRVQLTAHNINVLSCHRNQHQRHWNRHRATDSKGEAMPLPLPQHYRCQAPQTSPQKIRRLPATL